MSSNSKTDIDRLKVQKNLIEIFTECMMNYRRIWPYVLRFDQGVKNRWKQRKYFSFHQCATLVTSRVTMHFYSKKLTNIKMSLRTESCQSVIQNQTFHRRR